MCSVYIGGLLCKWEPTHFPSPLAHTFPCFLSNQVRWGLLTERIALNRPLNENICTILEVYTRQRKQWRGEMRSLRNMFDKHWLDVRKWTKRKTNRFSMNLWIPSLTQQMVQPVSKYSFVKQYFPPSFLAGLFQFIKQIVTLDKDSPSTHKMQFLSDGFICYGEQLHPNLPGPMWKK